LTHLCHSRVLGAVECTLYLSKSDLLMVLIREYDPTADYPALHASFVELQAWEQSFEPGLPAPDEAAGPYLAEVFRSCADTPAWSVRARARYGIGTTAAAEAATAAARPGHPSDGDKTKLSGANRDDTRTAIRRAQPCHRQDIRFGPSARGLQSE
jgi:hypothetical protein